MSTITFDTYKYVSRLEKAGISREQADAMVQAQSEAMAEALDTTLATKSDLNRMDGRLNLLQWMLGFNLAFTMAVLWKVLG